MEAVGVLSALGPYLQTIRVISSVALQQRKGLKSDAKLSEEISGITGDIEERISTLGKSNDALHGAHLRELASILPEVRVSFNKAKTRKEVNRAVKLLRDARDRLIFAPDTDYRPSPSPPPGRTICKEVQMESDTPSQLHSAEQDLATQIRRPGLHQVHFVDSPAGVDVIFVHGLNGEAYSTWQGQTPVFWPRDLLPRDLDVSSIWVYSYNTKIDMKLEEQKPLHPLLENLAYELIQSVQRRTGRSLIWVAHSLGGLLVKAALTLSWNASPTDHESQVCRRSQGVLFLGTPHTGTSLISRSALFTSIMSVVSEPKQPSGRGPFPGEKNLESTVALVTSNFAALIDDLQLPIVSFYENRPMLTKSGPFRVVESFTALHHPLESVEMLEGNHLTMCKFEVREEEGYQSVLRYLKAFRDHPYHPKQVEVMDRFMDKRTPSKGSTISDAVNTDIWGIYTKFRAKLDVPSAKWRSFKSGNHGDGMWIKDSKTFMEWYENDLPANPLLIHSPVGCGKTVAAESILEHLRDTFVEESPSPRTCHLHIFFRSDQYAHQDSIAILESLISQILDQNKVMVRHLQKPPEFSMSTPLAIALLEGTLRIMLEDTCWTAIYLVIDGLDECHRTVARSNISILRLMLDTQRVRAIFTTSTDALSSVIGLGTAEPGDNFPGQEADLTTLLRLYWKEKEVEFTELELRKDEAWKIALDSHIEEQLRLRFGTSGSSSTPVLSPDALESMKNSLVGLPEISFSVADAIIRNFQVSPYPGQRMTPPKGWLDSQLHSLENTASILQRLVALAQTQPREGVLTLSILACVFRPLRPDEVAVIIQHVAESDPTMPECNDWTSRLASLPDLMTTMKGMVRNFGEGLQISNSNLRCEIVRQMNTSSSSSPAYRDRALGEEFDSYERMHLRIAQACLRILLHSERINGQLRKDGKTDFYYLPGKVYAEKYWVRHLDEAGPEQVTLNRLVIEFLRIRQENTPAELNYPSTPSRVLTFLAAGNLSSSLSTIFSDNQDVLEYPEPEEFNKVLDKTLDASNHKTLESLGKVASEGKDTGFTKLCNTVIEISLGNVSTLDQRLKTFDDMSTKERLLCMALKMKQTNVVDVILRSVRHGPLTPFAPDALMIAVKLQDARMVQQLLNYKRLFEPKLNQSLIEATKLANEAICEVLLKNGADVNCKHGVSQSTPLHLAAKTGQANMVALILGWNAKVDPQDARDRTPLHRAAELGHDDVVKRLLSCSASIVAADKTRRTALFIACARGWKKTAKVLWHAGSNLMHRDRSEQTALHAAARTGYQNLVKVLLSAGIYVDCQDEQGTTPLHEACRCGWASIVEVMLDAGAEVNKTDYHGKTPLHYACESLNAPEVTVRLLLDRGANAAARTISVPLRSQIQHPPFSFEMQADPEVSAGIPYDASDSPKLPELVVDELSAPANARTSDGLKPNNVPSDLLLSTDRAARGRDTASKGSRHHASKSLNVPDMPFKEILDKETEENAKISRAAGSCTPVLAATQSSTVRVLHLFHEHDKNLFLDKDNQGNGVFVYVGVLEKTRSKMIRDEKWHFLVRLSKTLQLRHHMKSRSARH